jgi:two-component sensor histidine kinase/Tfp pilus assembly protein PilF
VQLFFYASTVNAQNFADKEYYLIDSLDFNAINSKEQRLIKNALYKYYKAPNDSLKIEAVYTIIKNSSEENIWSKYNQWIIDFIKTKTYKNNRLKITVLSNKSNFFKIKGDYDKAIKYYLQSLELEKELGDLNKIATAYDVLGGYYKRNGDFVNALEYYNKSLKIRITNKNKKEEGQMLNSIGYLYLNFGMHSQALEYFHKSLKIREEIADKVGVSFCFNNIASVHKQQGKPDIALKYYQKSLRIRKELNYKHGISVSLNNIGVVYKNEKKLEKALEYYQKSLAIKKELKEQKGVSHVLNNIGTIYKEQGKLTMALVKYEESLKMTTALHDDKWTAITLFNMGSVYLKQGYSTKAYKCASKSLRISKKIGHPELIRDAAEVLKEIYSKQHNWKSAFETQELYAIMRDSIRNKKTEVAATEQRVNYEVQKREQEIKLLSVQNDVLQREKEVQRLRINKNRILNVMFLVTGVVAFLLALFFYIVSKKRKVINRLLQKKDDEKKVMLKEIHHRVKNNLQVINSLLRLQSKEIKDEEIVAKFKETQKRIITIAALHEKMYSSEDLRHVNIKEHIESIVADLVTSYALDKKITIKINIEQISIGLRTLVPLGLIINEIVVNSLKYAFCDSGDGIINLQIKQLNNTTFEMLIGDNGVGLKSYKNTSGLGSKLISIFTKQLNGTLEIMKVPGTTYKIIFEKIDIE